MPVIFRKVNFGQQFLTSSHIDFHFLSPLVLRVQNRCLSCRTEVRQAKRNCGLSKKKDLEAEDKLPLFDFGKLHPEKTRLYGFGSTTEGALGLNNLLRPKREGQKIMKYVNRPVRNLFGDIKQVEDITAGHGFTIVKVKPQEESSPVLYGCGYNTHSQIGFQAVRPEAPLEVLIAFTPILLPFRKQPKILAMGAGRAHSVISLGQGGIITFGDNSNGQCGRMIINDETYFGSKLFHKMERFGSTVDDDIVSISARYDVTFCISRNGKVYSFGTNQQGQLGRGTKIKRAWEPALVAGDIEGEKVTKIATNGSSVLAITDNGELFSWGNNECGEINPEETCRTLHEPKRVKLHPKIGKVKDIAVGELFSLLLNDKGNVYSWGLGKCLGLGPTNLKVKSPTIIPPPLFGRSEFSPNARIEKIYAGFFYCLAVTTSGDLYSWGVNEAGCLGLGQMEIQYFPLKVCLNGSAEKVGIGVDHTVVLAKGSI